MKAILAIDSYSHVIGSSETFSGIPWGRIKEDMDFFKEKTLGCTVVMGWNTYETLPEQGLKGRENIVIARENSVKYGVKFTESVEMLDKKSEDVYCIGGLSTILKCMPYIKTFYVTWVTNLSDNNFEGDVTFPVRLLYGAEEKCLGRVATKTRDGVDVALKFVEYNLKGMK